jgi:hypothetical protein
VTTTAKVARWVSLHELLMRDAERDTTAASVRPAVIVMRKPTKVTIYTALDDRQPHGSH